MKCRECIYYQPSKKNPLKGSCTLRNNEYYQDIRYGHLQSCKKFGVSNNITKEDTRMTREEAIKAKMEAE